MANGKTVEKRNFCLWILYKECSFSLQHNI